MAVGVAHGGAPEVIQQQMVEGRSPQDVTVVADGGNVVVDKVTVQRVDVAKDRARRRGRVNAPNTRQSRAFTATHPTERRTAGVSWGGIDSARLRPPFSRLLRGIDGC